MSYFKIRSSQKTSRKIQTTRNYLSNSISIQKSKNDKQLNQIQKSFDILLHKQIINTSDDQQKNKLINNNNNQLLIKFKEAIKGSQNKIQRQMVNVITKKSQTLLHNHKKQIQNIKISITNTQKQLKNLYQLSHQLYLKMQQIRKQNFQKYKIKLSLIQFNKKHQQIKSSEKIKQKHIKSLYQQYSILNNTLIQFLLILLKQGYFQQNGLKWLLTKLVQLNYKPKFQQFPSILDAVSRNCLLKQYNNLKRQHQFQNLNNQKIRNKKAKSQGQLFSQRNNSKIKQVYNDAQSYIQNWVRSQRWKKKQFFPSMHLQRKDKKIQMWQNQQKRRINNLYQGEQKRKIIKLMFGIKLDSIL